MCVVKYILCESDNSVFGVIIIIHACSIYLCTYIQYVFKIINHARARFTVVVLCVCLSVTALAALASVQT